MARSLYSKFILGYLIFGLLSVLTIATFSSGITRDYLVKDRANALYDEANDIAASCSLMYQGQHQDMDLFSTQLKNVSTYLRTEIWVVNKSGVVIMDSKNGYPLDMTFPVGEASIYYYAPFIWSNDGDLISEDGLTADGYFNSDKNAAVFQYFRGLVENKYMSATPIENLFESGRAAFKFDGAWEVNTIYQSYSDIDLGVAPYIVSDNWDGGRYTPTGSWAYAATTKTEHIEAATELVKWMSGVDSGVLLYENTKSMPSTYAAYDQITTFEDS